jgi:hypothetical protein
MQALQFLDQALAGQEPLPDASLLWFLRRTGQPLTWLRGPLGAADANAALAGWYARVDAELRAQSVLPQAALEGLAYRCGSGEGARNFRIQNGEARQVPFAIPPSGPAGQYTAALSRDGRYLATINDGETQVITIQDLQSDWQVRVELPRGAYLMGWSAGGYLVYVQEIVPVDDFSPQQGRVMRLDPLTGERLVLSERPVIPALLWGDPWLPDGSALVLGMMYANRDESLAPWLGAPTLVPVDAPGEARLLNETGYAAVVSPDGRWVAYAVPTVLAVDDWRLSAVGLSDLQTGEHRELLHWTDVVVGENPPQPGFMVPAAWSPGSDYLVVLADVPNQGQGLFVVPADGRAPWRVQSEMSYGWPLGFGADGHTLALVSQRPGSNVPSLVLLDLAEGQGERATVLADDVFSAAWSPDGTRLALAGPAGVRVVDPAAGQWRWVTLEPCEGVRWLSAEGT